MEMTRINRLSSQFRSISMSDRPIPRGLGSSERPNDNADTGVIPLNSRKNAGAARSAMNSTALSLEVNATCCSTAPTLTLIGFPLLGPFTRVL